MSAAPATGDGLKLVARGAAPPAPDGVIAGTFVVGRSPDCDLVLADPSVSRRHARLLPRGGELLVEDLGSSGGTFVNGQRVERAAAGPGDVLRFGPRVEYAIQPEGAAGGLRRAAARGGDEGVRHLQTLLEVARELASAPVLDEVLEIVLHAAVKAMGAAGGFLGLRGDEGGWRALTVHPVGSSLSREHDELLRRALAERRTIVAEAMLELAETTLGAEEVVATPLVVARRPLGAREDASVAFSLEVVGAVLVARPARGQGFPPDELAVLESLASEAAQAIDSAVLYRQAREAARVEHEMTLARTIQDSLLRPPPEVPFAQISVWSAPARAIGGDLYHAALRPDGTLAVGVGDIAGKGIAAALLMAMMEGLLEVFNDLGWPLGELVPLLDRSLRKNNPGNKFLTLATALLHPDGRLEIVNAGHCPVALLRAAGTVETVRPTGPLLGLLPRAAWTVREMRLAPGDTLVFYSDGICESASPAEEEFGVGGVERTLRTLAGKSPGEILAELLEAVVRHREGAEAGDDVTMLAVSYRG